MGLENYPKRYPLGAEFNCDTCSGKGWHPVADDSGNDTGREKICTCAAGAVRSLHEDEGVLWSEAVQRVRASM